MKKQLLSFYINIKKNHLIYLFLALIPFIIFISISIFIYNSKTIPNIDINLRDFCYNFRGEKYSFYYWFFRIITEFGFVFILIPLFFLFLVFTRLDLRSLILGVGTFITYLCNEFTKLIFLRERPLEANRWMFESSTSYPSGHTMTSVFFYGLIIYFIFKSDRPRKTTKTILISIITILCTLIGFSRMVLGVHYFTDVIAGMFFSISLIFTAIYIYNILNDKGFTFLKSRFFKEKITN